MRGKDKTYIWVSVQYTGLLGELEHLKIETRLDRVLTIPST